MEGCMAFVWGCANALGLFFGCREYTCDNVDKWTRFWMGAAFEHNGVEYPNTFFPPVLGVVLGILWFVTYAVHTWLLMPHVAAYRTWWFKWQAEAELNDDRRTAKQKEYDDYLAELERLADEEDKAATQKRARDARHRKREIQKRVNDMEKAYTLSRA